MKKLKMVMGILGVVSILLIAKLSIAESSPEELVIQPVSVSQQQVVHNSSYSSTQTLSLEESSSNQ